MNIIRKIRNVAYIPLVLILTSCGGRGVSAPDRLDNIGYSPQPVERLHTYFFENGDVRADSAVVSTFLNVVGVPDETSWRHSAAVAVFTPSVDSVFHDVSVLENSIGHILAASEAYGLSLPRRKYATVVYGRTESIMFADASTGDASRQDSVMFIALNHYLGADYPGYSHWPAYVRAVKTPDNLPYDIAEALVATAYPFVGSGGTPLVSRLLYEGVLVEARMRLVENPDEALALGYDDNTLSWLRDNERAIWESIVSKNMVYDTSLTLQERLVAPSPSTAQLLVADSPGRIGRYIGYRIVRAYLEKNPETAFSLLLSPEFYASPQDVLSDSQYNPGK